MTEIHREIFHGMTPDEVWYKYKEWYSPRTGAIEIVKEHPTEPSWCRYRVVRTLTR